MKRIVILFFLIAFLWVQDAHAEFLNLGSSEIIILTIVGFIFIVCLALLIFFILFLVKRFKSVKREK